MTVSGENRRVFISSTCYDLIDIRAEVEGLLREFELTPILSDRGASEFIPPRDRDAIEACLYNVRSSGLFICVLNQRYGPSLKSAGFDDVSATHLEYREARRAQLPIYLYVRDRLVSDFEVWKANGRKPKALKLPWVQDAKNYRLLEFLDEHRTLSVGSTTSNWCWPFRDSLELKQRIAIDLQVRASRALFSAMMTRGQVPVLAAQVSRVQPHGVLVSWKNFGAVAALDIQMRIGGDEPKDVGNLVPGGESSGLRIPREPDAPLGLSGVLIELTYWTPHGHELGDTFEVVISSAGMVRIRARSRRLIEFNAFGKV